MNTILVALPESLHRAADEYARRECVTVEQLIASALAEKLSTLGRGSALAERAARADSARFQRALASIPDVEPDPEDRID